MRSRYTAFVLNDAAYLLETWHASTRPLALDREPATRWLGLKVLGTEAGGSREEGGTVEVIGG